jgi:hypothetical protein
MPSVGWGNDYSLSDHTLVGGNDEIPVGKYAYVFNMQNGVATIPKATWEAMLNGDFTSVKNQIESGIPGAQVKMIHCAWDKADYVWWMGSGAYAVSGFRVEALVYNAGASQTGLEIVAIIMAVAFIIAVITACVVSGWVVWQVMDAAKQLGPAVTVGVGLAILAGIAILAFVFIGGRAQYKGKKRQIAIGKGQIDE